MIPFFFGAAERQLFGIYEPAREPSRGRGVVICYPWGQEYLRCHQSCRFLARLLANAGVHVLRFDYYGTGDSAGEMEDASLRTWIEDITLAAGELRDMGNVSRVSLVGLRLGALLAAEAITSVKDVERLVLWDPTGGPAYLEELVALAGEGPRRPRYPITVEGFPLTAAMAEEITALDPSRLETISPAAYLVTARDAATSPLARDVLSARGVVKERLTYDGPVVWEDSGELGTAGMPVQALRGMTAWLTA